ncbi:MAG TPA: ATP-binding protein [Acidimicrobiales bacterium]|jgi:signal transduction histidine kinase|nr:ATP-binding protein [Acidimicrobiales bacterium]
MAAWADVPGGGGVVAGESLQFHGGVGRRRPGPDDEAVAALCRELAGPTTAVRALAEAIAVPSGSGGSLGCLLRQLLEEDGRIAEICDHVQRGAGSPSPLRLDVVAAEVARAAGLRYRGRIDVVSQPVTVAVHRAVLSRVVANLVDNACRVTSTGGLVRVTVGVRAAMGRVEVADSGPGLGAGRRGRFSCGLGIVESLVGEHGGTTVLAGSDLGGASVAVTFPLAGPGGAEAHPDGQRLNAEAREAAVAAFPGGRTPSRSAVVRSSE